MERANALTARCRTGSRQDKGNRLFELQLVVDRHYHRLVDVRVPLLAAADEHVVAATNEIREAVAITAEHVIGDVKAVAGQRSCGHFGQVVGPAHQGRTAHLQHALACRAVIPHNQPQLDTRMCEADRQIGGRPAVGMRGEDDRSSLGRAVAVGDDRAQKARRAGYISPSETGAEPIRSVLTADRSVSSSIAVSRNISAIIAGTEVSVVTR
jgi:hypothetical protein